MIPPNLAAFRALMLDAEAYALESAAANAIWEGRRDWLITEPQAHAAALRALATATPAQLCGIVGEVCDGVAFTALDQRCLIVTPRKGEG